MIYDIIWSNQAEITFYKNLDYLKEEWNRKTIIAFINRVEDILKKISLSPKLFPVYRTDESIHKCVVNRQITVYYKITESSIILLSFWNSYQDPKKPKF